MIDSNIDDCPICGISVSDTESSFTLDDRRKGLPGSWTLRECAGCAVIRMTPIPDTETLENYYSAYSKDESLTFSVGQGSRFPTIRKLFHRLSGDVDPRDFIDVPSGARVLDYGCGLAGYLSDFHHRGIAISGAEIAGYVVEACRQHGYDVHQVDDFSRIPFADAEFDIVYLMQVFEHLRDPRGFLEELDRVLKPGGVLYLAVPNAASIWRKIFGDNWVSGWYAPFHLYHYNRHSLSALAQKQDFELADSWTSTPESWFRLNLKAVFFPREKRLDWSRSWLDLRPVRYLAMILLRLFEIPVKERDCLVVKFEKKGRR